MVSVILIPIIPLHKMQLSTICLVQQHNKVVKYVWLMLHQRNSVWYLSFTRNSPGDEIAKRHLIVDMPDLPV